MPINGGLSAFMAVVIEQLDAPRSIVKIMHSGTCRALPAAYVDLPLEVFIKP
jgi:hypothetical protein